MKGFECNKCDDNEYCEQEKLVKAEIILEGVIQNCILVFNTPALLVCSALLIFGITGLWCLSCRSAGHLPRHCRSAVLVSPFCVAPPSALLVCNAALPICKVLSGLSPLALSW